MDYIDNEYDRNTGQSTARRLLALAYACLGSGAQVEFIDHMPNTAKQAARHCTILREYVAKLGLSAKVTRCGSRVFVTAFMPRKDKLTAERMRSRLPK